MCGELRIRWRGHETHQQLSYSIAEYEEIYRIFFSFFFFNLIVYSCVCVRVISFYKLRSLILYVFKILCSVWYVICCWCIRLDCTPNRARIGIEQHKPCILKKEKRNPEIDLQICFFDGNTSSLFFSLMCVCVCVCVLSVVIISVWYVCFMCVNWVHYTLNYVCNHHKTN